jgi:hypothetical protein
LSNDEKDNIILVPLELWVLGGYAGSLKEGSAFYIKGEEECLLENRGESDAVYIIAGGHSKADGH